MGSRVVRRGLRRMRVPAVLVVVLSLLAPVLPAAAGSHQTLWWSGEGNSFTTFGANGSVTIYQGTATAGTCDFIYPATDIYVVTESSLSDGQTLTDVSNAEGLPNTVQLASGGLFISETIAFTAPGGNLGPGRYGVVYDECQDKKFDAGVDRLFYPAFDVVIPVDIPPVDPRIAEIKARAQQQADSWNHLVQAVDAIELLLEIKGWYECISGGLGGCALSYLTDQLKSFLEDAVMGGLGLVDPKEAAKDAVLDTISHYGGIAADPPDPNFAQPSPLQPHQPIVDPDADPLSQALTRVGTAARVEAALAESLLRSMERYQGADAAGDGTWALVHARAMADTAARFSQQLAASDAAVAGLAGSLQSDSRDLDQAIVEARALRDRIATSGFTEDEARELRNRGLDDTEIAQLRDDIAAIDHLPFEEAVVLDDIDFLRASITATRAALDQLALDMAAVAAHLESQAVVADTVPVAHAGGPYTSTEGGSLTLDGTGSSDGDGTISGWGWDLDGDGAFDDASGATPTVTTAGALDGLIGLRVVDADGKVGIGYARLTVPEVNRPPTLDATAPTDSNVVVEVGTPASFTATATDPDGDATDVRWLVDLEEAASTSTFSYQPTLDQLGVHVVAVDVSDGQPGGGSVQREWTVSVVAPDADGDGWRANLDCDDAEPDVNPGRFEVVGNGVDDDCDPATGDAGTAPTASFAVTPARPTVGDDVTFTDTSGDPDGPIAAWSWDFGDGTSSTAQHPVHRFATAGTFTVSLTVTDSQGDTATTTQDVRVAVAPTADFTVSPQLPTPGTAVAFTDTSTDADGAIEGWAWDFGDGTTSSEQHPTHTYGAAGTYEVSLTVTDGDGLSDTHTTSLRLAGPPVADFATGGGLDVARLSDGATVAGFSTVYSTSTSYRPTNAIDDSTSSAWYTASSQEQWLTVTLVPGGPHVVDRVLLRGASDGPRDVEVQVSTTGTADADFATVTTVEVPNTAGPHQFAFAAMHASHVRLLIHTGWSTRVRLADFQVREREREGGVVSLSDGPVATAEASTVQSTSTSASAAIDRNPSTAWRTPNGTPTGQSLTVDLGGDSHVIDRVRLSAALASYAPRDLEILVSDSDDPASFRSVVSATGAAGTTLQAFSFPPTSARFVKLVVHNTHGACCVSISRFQVLTELGTNVADGEGVGATVLDASSGAANVGNLIDFSPATAWSTPSGQSSNQHVDVLLIPGGPHQIDRVRLQAPGGTVPPRTVEILAGPSPDALQPVANAVLPNDGQPHWLKFPPVEANVVRLRVVDNHGASTLQVSDFRVFSGRQGGSAVAFDDHSQDPDDNLASWHWDFGDGSTSSERHPVHVFPGPGTYQVTLTVTDADGLASSTTATHRVLHNPAARFSWSPPEPVEGQSVAFTDTSTDVDGTIEARSWSFQHTPARPASSSYNTSFPDDGQWLATLAVTDSQMLTGSATSSVTVANAPPAAEAAPATQTTHWGVPIANTSTVRDPGTVDSQSLVCDWDFGDGTTLRIPRCNSSNVRTAHSYADPGTYTAALEVQDKDGASVTDTATVTVTPRPTMVSVHTVPGSARRGQVDVVARVWDRIGWQPLAGETLTFALDGSQVPATTDASGAASARLPLPTAGGTLTASFAGNSHYAPSSESDHVDPFQSRPPGDIVFVIDESGSMSDDQAAVRSNVAAIAQQLGADVDHQLGLVGFGAGTDHDADFVGGGHLHLPFTDELDPIRSALGELVISGGFEPGYQALEVAMGDASGFREGAGVCAVLIGDESANQGLQVTDQAEARAALDARGATLFAVVDPVAGAGYSQLAAQTGGATFDIRDFRNDPEPVLRALVETCVADITQRPDLEVEISDGTDSVAAGATTTYTVAVTNTGLRTAPEAVLAVEFPPGVALVAADGATVSGSQISWSLGDVVDSATTTRSLTVRYGDDLTDGSTITVPAIVTFDEAAAGRDLTPANNEASDTNGVERRNLPPTADHLAVTTDEDTPLDITLTGGSPTGAPLTFTVVDAPTNGTVNGTAPTLRYIPDADWHGTDRLTFRTSAGGLDSGLATVTIEVRPVNDPPTVSLAPAGPLDEGTGTTLRATAADRDGDALAFAWTSDGGSLIGDGATAELAADDGPAAVTVGVTVSDATASATANQVVEVRNLAPTVDAGADRAGYWGVPFRLAATVTDPSTADSAAGFTHHWDLGDGTTSTAPAPAHAYADPGRYEVSATATDKDGGVGADASTVQVEARPTSLYLTGDTAAAFGYATLSARLVDDVDAATARLAGRELVFTVAGVEHRAVIDGSGVAVVPEPVLALPGTSAVEVRFAGDAHYLASQATGSLTVTSTPGKVTGGGITTADGANAGFVVSSDAGGVAGELQFTRRDGGASLHVHDFLALGISADATSAWFAGTDGAGGLVVVHVEDAGEPGRGDGFRLWLDGARLGGDAEPLRGNIEIHPPAPGPRPRAR